MTARKFVYILAALLLLAAPTLYLLKAPRQPELSNPQRNFAEYIKAAYARDFKKAYGYVSSEDMKHKTEQTYLMERGTFSGFTLAITRKLSRFVTAEPLDSQVDEARARVKLKLRYPDANSLSQLLLDWDEDKLNALSQAEQKKILASIDQMKRAGKISYIEGEEEATLVKEDGQWKLFLNWAAGVEVNFAVAVPESAGIEAKPLTETTRIRRNEPFIIVFRVKNLSPQRIQTRINHIVEPKDVSQYLRLFECALLIPVRLDPGEERDFASMYMVDGDLPDNAKKLQVRYEFKMEN